MNKFEETYLKIISEDSTNQESLNQQKDDNVSKKFDQNAFNDFIGRKYIIAHVVFDFSKNINENDFRIMRAAIKDVKIEKSGNNWELHVIFDNDEKDDYFFYNRVSIYEKSRMKLTPEKLNEKLNREFYGGVSYIGSYSDHWGNENNPEGWYTAEDKGQTDDQIKKLLKAEVSKDIKKEQDKIMDQINSLNNKISSFNKFLGEENE